MKRIILAFAVLLPILAPATMLGANGSITNPYPTSSPARNFFNNLNGSQKVLTIFYKDITEAKKEADDAAGRLAESILKDGNQRLSVSVLEAVLSQLNGADKARKTGLKPGYLAAQDSKILLQARNDISNALIDRAVSYLNEHPQSRKEESGADKRQAANQRIGGAMDKISALLAKNKLGFDESGFWLKYDDNGKVVEREMPEVYMRQEGDVYNDVPFFAQAPGGGWYDTCQASACEEAALAQAHMWVNKTRYKDIYGIYKDDDMLQQYALRQILAMCDYQYKNNYSHLYHDTSISQTGWLWQSFYGRPARVVENPSAQVLKSGLRAGYVYVVPISGQKLLMSPPYKDISKIPVHSILLIGYNDKRKEFIVNDPGTWRGNGWRYNQDDFMAAIRDYPSGHGEKVLTDESRVLELGPGGN